MTEQPQQSSVSPLSAGVRGKCPRCGVGSLFDGYLETAKGCKNCGLDYEFFDSGDGPAVFIILIAGFIIVAAALITEINYQPPYWVHALLWLPLGLILPIGLLRPAKGILLCLQYYHQAREGRTDPE